MPPEGFISVLRGGGIHAGLSVASAGSLGFQTGVGWDGVGSRELAGSQLHLTAAPPHMVLPSCALPPSATIQNWNSLRDELV